MEIAQHGIILCLISMTRLLTDTVDYEVIVLSTVPTLILHIPSTQSGTQTQIQNIKRNNLPLYTLHISKLGSRLKTAIKQSLNTMAIRRGTHL